MVLSRKDISLIIIAFALCCKISIAQATNPSQVTVGEYIAMYKDLAMDEMIQYKIPASITMAQGIHESTYGNSPLAVNANNHFGIKCHKEWTGLTYIKDDDEKDECFRMYADAAESYHDHSLFLTTREWYKPLFILDITDYKAWAYGLKQAGYATNPKYPEILIRIIEENRLYELDQAVISGRVQEVIVAEKDTLTVEEVEINLADYRNQWIAEQLVPLEMGGLGRQVYENYGVKCIIAKEGDNFYNVASEFGIYHRQIYNYNELGRKDTITPGEVIYIEPKKNKGKEKSHKIIYGESLRDVSQRYGITLKGLCRINSFEENEQVSDGQIISLQR